MTYSEESETSGLHTGLSRRQISLIAIGGVIGAGFFVGSRVAVAEAGPGIIISYLVAGTIVVLVMRMLGEMAVAHPDTGSFSVYADRSIGRWAGFTIGWLYSWFWLLALAVEAVAGAQIAALWWPQLDPWVWTLILIALLTVTNLISVKFYGEFEFWFASTKVLAIVVFIVLALIAIFGWWPNLDAPGAQHLLGDGGFLPNGVAPIFGALPVIIFSLFGVEIATIAAGESDNPARAVTAAVRSVIGRILVFYVLGMTLILTLVTWSDPGIQDGPFLAAVRVLQIPHAEFIVELIVFVAVLSCLNSAMYTASRMMYSLALRGDAPRAFARTSRGGVPWVTTLVCVGVGVLTAIANIIWEQNEVFGLVLASSGGVGLFVWLAIAFSQLGTRRVAQARGQTLALRMWGYPWLTVLVIVVLCALAVLCIVLPDQRTAMLTSTGLAVVVAIVGIARRGFAKAPFPEDHAAPGTPNHDAEATHP